MAAVIRSWNDATATVYPASQAAIILGEIDWAADDIKFLLCTSSYTPAPTDRFRSDIQHEVEGRGYESGGSPLTGRTASTSDAGKSQPVNAARRRLAELLSAWAKRVRPEPAGSLTIGWIDGGAKTTFPWAQHYHLPADPMPAERRESRGWN